MQAKDLKLTDEVLEVIKGQPSMADVFEELGFELDEALEEVDKAEAWVDEFVKGKVNISHIIAEFVRTMKAEPTFDDYLRTLLLFDKVHEIMKKLEAGECIDVSKVDIGKGAVVLAPQNEDDVVGHFITRNGDKVIETAFRTDIDTAMKVVETIAELKKMYDLMRQTAMIVKVSRLLSNQGESPCPECDEPTEGEGNGSDNEVAD